MIEPNDANYFRECLADIRLLCNPIIIKRCVAKKREGTSEYPDDPIKPDRVDLHERADFAAVTGSDVEKSGGTVLAGDVRIWTTIPLRGPELNNLSVPEGVADIVQIYGNNNVLLGEYVVIGISDRGFLTDGFTPGYSTLIRRRAVPHGGEFGSYSPTK